MTLLELIVELLERFKVLDDSLQFFDFLRNRLIQGPDYSMDN